MTTPFGKIITGADVEAAVEATIRLWQADYIAEVTAQAGMDRGAIQNFRSFPRMLDMNKRVEDQIPSCVISAPGTMQTPTVRDRKVNVRWALGVGCIAAARDMASTLRLCQLYCAAVRTLILQHASLGGFSDGVSYISERYDELTSDRTRSMASGVVQFGVDVLGVTDMSQGLVVPTTDATETPGPWPTVSTVNLDIEGAIQ